MAAYTLDRFEGEKAVLLLKGDESVEKVLARDELPEGAKEGDIIDLDSHTILKKETEDARKHAQSLLEKLKNKKL